MSVKILLILLSSVILSQCEHDNRVITTLKHSKFYFKPTVINGLPARHGQVPYVVSIKEPLVRISKNRFIWTNICGGSIIGPTKVLTAAHCFEAKDFYYYKHPNLLRIVAGDFTTELIHSGTTDTTPKSQWRTITKVILHNAFNFPENDIAVATVDEAWKYNDNVNFVLTARRRTDYSGGTCVAAGFGSISDKEDIVSPILLVGRLFLLPQENCSLLFEMNMDRFICSYAFMSDVGSGDSGGPLACSDTSDPVERQAKGKPLLVGLVSGKNFDRTALFTRISHYNDWINHAANNTPPTRAVCRLSMLAVIVLIVILYLYCLFCGVLILTMFVQC